MRKWMLGALLVCWILPAMVAGVGEAVAQPVALSETQKALNEKGVLAIIDGEFDRAIGLLLSSLALGETNVTYLNLGRAYARNGDCVEALDAYAKAETAPAVEAPSAAEVLQVLERYRSEVDMEKCPARVTLECEPATLRVEIDGGDAMACPTVPLKLAAGPHYFRAVYRERAAELEVELAPAEVRTLRLVVDTSAPLPGGDEGLSATALWGTIVGSVGLATLVTAVIIDFAVLGPDIEAYERGDGGSRSSIETLQGVNLGLFIGGGVMVATGLALLL